jgi:nucleoside 2-deoxyribosyltransferase
MPQQDDHLDKKRCCMTARRGSQDARKVFLAGPFKSLVDAETGRMDDEQRRVFVDLIAIFEDRGYAVHNAHKREAWGERFMAPEECTRVDFEEIGSCDHFVALPGHPASPGTHVEIGWASALGKPLTLLLEENKEYAFLVRGLHAVADVQIVPFASPSECLRKLDQLFPALVASRGGASA